MDKRIFVSIIVPVFNAQKTIEKLLDSLEAQTYPKNDIEIIVVDNNSTDETKNIIKKYDVKFLEEKKVQSSYAARNKGIKHSKGDVIAFIDSDCVAKENWVREAIKIMNLEKADLVGGKINFIFSKKKSASEFYDAITHLNADSNIRNMSSAGTCNLFVHSKVIKDVGLFPNSVRSGGDMQFTYKCVQGGYKLIYAPDVIVFHPTRNFKQMIRKSYRIGTGCIEVLLSRKTNKIKILKEILKDFVPQSIQSIKKSIEEKGTSEMKCKLFEMFIVGYIFKIIRGIGTITKFHKLFQKNKI